jgi:hypothetical protein
MPALPPPPRFPTSALPPGDLLPSGAHIDSDPGYSDLIRDLFCTSALASQIGEVRDLIQRLRGHPARLSGQGLRRVLVAKGYPLAPVPEEKNEASAMVREVKKVKKGRDRKKEEERRKEPERGRESDRFKGGAAATAATGPRPSAPAANVAGTLSPLTAVTTAGKGREGTEDGRRAPSGNSAPPAAAATVSASAAGQKRPREESATEEASPPPPAQKPLPEKEPPNVLLVNVSGSGRRLSPAAATSITTVPILLIFYH